MIFKYSTTLYHNKTIPLHNIIDSNFVRNFFRLVKVKKQHLKFRKLLWDQFFALIFIKIIIVIKNPNRSWKFSVNNFIILNIKMKGYIEWETTDEFFGAILYLEVENERCNDSLENHSQ